jgi:hypothetical protein
MLGLVWISRSVFENPRWSHWSDTHHSLVFKNKSFTIGKKEKLARVRIDGSFGHCETSQVC